MCRRHQYLLFESQYNEDSGLLSTLNVRLSKGNMEVFCHATYNADVVHFNGMKMEEFGSGIERIIPISYCPMCGRKLKDC